MTTSIQSKFAPYSIIINRITLTDGSQAFDVVFGSIKLFAVTETDAQELALKLQHAVHDHTVDTAEIIWGYCRCAVCCR